MNDYQLCIIHVYIKYICTLNDEVIRMSEHHVDVGSCDFVIMEAKVNEKWV